MPQWYMTLKAAELLRCTPWDVEPSQGSPLMRQLWARRALVARAADGAAQKYMK